MRKFIYSICLILVLCFSVQAYEFTWGWVKASNNVDHHWDIETGPAYVSINGNKFSAILYWKDQPSDPKIILKGTIRGKTIMVKETIHGSDYTGSIYTGTYNKKKEVETINLSDGFGLIGITRAVSK
jgi:hypothetical protein